MLVVRARDAREGPALSGPHLPAALDPLLRGLTGLCFAAAGMQRYAVVLAEGGSLVVRAAGTVSGPVTIEPVPLALSSEVPRTLAEHVFRTGHAALLADAAHEPGFNEDPYVVERAPRSALAIPIRRRSETVGVLYLESDVATSAFSADLARALELAAASLIERSLLLEERDRAEDALRFLEDAGVSMSSSMHYARTLADVARLTVPFLADACLVDVIVEGGIFRRVAEAHADRSKEPLLRALREHRYFHDVPHSVAATLAEGHTAVFPELPDATLERLGLDACEIGLVRRLGVRTAMVVPIIARERHIGAIVLGAEALGRYGEAEVALVEGVARQAALAIDNARLYSDAQEAIRLRDEFLQLASHELNTPLTSLQLAVELIAGNRSGSPEVVHRAVQIMGRQVSRLSLLVRQMLEVARIQRAVLALRLEPLDLAAVVRDALELFGPQLTRAGCALSLEVHEPVVGRWDRPSLEQVVTSLLSNAVKFGPGKPIEIAVERRGDIGRLVVRDHGIGIAPGDLPHIFERFGRGVPSAHYGGLGLGLYIVRELVQALGGSVIAESAAGAGSTFTVELPLAGPRSRQLQATQEHAPS